jgi:mRNA interferase MazF
MPYPRGAVVTAGDPFGTGAQRPYLVCSNDSHPFDDEECITAVVTTTERPAAVALDDGDFERGSLPRQSYVSPWNPMTLKDATVGKHVATVSDALVDEVVAELNSYVQ